MANQVALNFGYLVDLLKEFRDGIFAILGVMIGAWSSRRSELMRLRIERRTEIFNEACDLTARYYVNAFSGRLTTSFLSEADEDSFMVTVMCLDRKILTHFSTKGYKAWRRVEAMIGRGRRPTDTATAFTEARASALTALGKELR
jgi:hypothetical protein